MVKPLFSIIIVTYNGKAFVERCVNSVLSSNSKSMEVVVVDNGSTDGSVDFLNKKYQSFKHQGKFICIGLDKNYGPSMARNIGVKNSRGKYIGFLDNDTVVDPRWADEAVKEFRKDEKLGVIQCKLLVAKQKEAGKRRSYLIDYVGEYLGQNGFLVQRCDAGEIDRGQFDQVVEILAAKSAGMFISREVFEATGGFDSDYFIYVEETDLGWRCWLAGYRCIFVPSSVVYHEFGTSTLILGKNKQDFNTKFHGCKNYILTLVKNLESRSLLKILPIHIFLWIGLAHYSLIFGKRRNFLWIHKALFWNLIHLRESWLKRRFIQNQRKLNDKDLFEIVMKDRPWKYFLDKITIKRKLGNAYSFTKKRII